MLGSAHGHGKNGYQAVASGDVEMGTVHGSKSPKPEESTVSRALSTYELLSILSPYFWPAGNTKHAFLNRLRSLSTWLMVILSKLCNIVAPFFLITATNSLLAKQFASAGRDITIFLTLRFLGSFFKEMQSILYISVKQQAAVELQSYTFAHLHKLSLQWHISKKTGSVMKSMDRGIDAASSIVSYLFLFLVPAIAECLAVCILFFAQYGQYSLGATVLGGVSFYALTTIIITQWRKKFREQSNKKDNDFHEKATDSILNYETVKYFTNEQLEVDRFTEAVEKFQVHMSATSLSLNLLNISQQLILNLTMLACMIIAGKAVVSGEMTIGSWIAVQSWVATVFAPLNFLGTIYGAVFQAFIDIRNLSELLAQTPDVVDDVHAKDLVVFTHAHLHDSYHNSDSIGGAHHMRQSDPIQTSVEFKDVTFHYPEQPPEKGLQHVSFVVPSGTTTAIVGYTGSGKTTLSRLLFRFYDPHEGEVLINGADIKHCTQKSVRQAIGVVPQDTVLFNDTILYNIQYGRMDATLDEVMAAAKSAQIYAFVESLPEKWNTLVGERGLKLSGGEKQRVAIARCLLKNPPIVLLDEATSALDTLTEHSIQEALNALGKHRTVLVIAHRLSTIRNAQQIVVMDKGLVREIGSHDQLMRIPNGLYHNMWTMQLNASGNPNIDLNMNLM